MSLPDLSLWTYEPGGNWTHPLTQRRLEAGKEDTYVAQAEHFCAVVRGEVTPLVTCQDGIANMQVVAAIKRSAATGQVVRLQETAP